MRPRFTYSRWDGTQQGFDMDALSVFDQLSDELLYHGDVNTALRRMMQQGLRDRQGNRSEGLREMLKKIRQQRQELLERSDLGGVYAEINDELNDIVAEERLAVDQARAEAEASGDERRAAAARSAAEERQFSLDMLPNDLAGKVRELQSYDFESAEAEQRFEAMLDKLRQQLMQQTVDQMSSAVQNMSPEQMARTKDMLAALNEMLERRQRNEDPRFEEFMENYGDFFPENPQTLDELLELMARRMAAMQAMLNSMTPEQRAQLQQLSDQLMEDMDLRWQMDQLGRNLQQMFPQMGWDQSYDFEGGDPMGMAQAMDTMQQLGDLDQMEQMLGGAPNPGALAEVDVDRLRELLGDESAEALQRLAELSKMLEDAGLVTQREGRLQLTPKGLRQIGSNSLRDLFGALAKDRAGQHPQHRRGSGHERSFETKPYEYGDPFNLDLQRTLRNAVRRQPGTPLKLRADDFEIEQTEHLTRTSTVLMLDLSQSMLLRDNFLPAKKVTMALHALISSQFPRDYLGVIGFASVARELNVAELPEVGCDVQWGTNMQHGFALARRLLNRQGAGGTKQIVMITDGEPTAHIDPVYGVAFNYPPTRETVEATMKEVLRCTKDHIRINSYVLDVNDYLRAFIEQMAAINRGRVFYTTPDRLGEYVLVDYLSQRGGRTRRVS